MRMINAKTILCVCMLFFVWFYIFPGRANAAVGLTIEPAIIEEGVVPGQVFSSVIKATNLDEVTHTFYIVKRDIRELSAGGQPLFAKEGEKTEFEMSSWINIPKTSIVIKAGETEEIPFSITVPVGASAGGHFGGLFLSMSAPELEESGVGVGYQVGTIINLRIAGEIREEAKIREFSTDKAIYGSPNVDFIIGVENLGNVLIRPRGLLEITDFWGRKLPTMIVNDAGGAVLPGGTREFETTWEGGMFDFGRYQVVMSLVYGREGRQTISSTLSFWILPLKVILPIVGGILALIVLVLALMQFHIKKKVKELRRATQGSSYGRRLGPTDSDILRRGKRESPSSLALIAIALLLFTFLFMTVLFFLFA